MPGRDPCPIPPGTPEARAAVERVKRILAEEERQTKPLVLPRSRRRDPRICGVCGRRVRTPGETRCWRHRS